MHNALLNKSNQHYTIKSTFNATLYLSHYLVMFLFKPFVAIILKKQKSKKGNLMMLGV